MEYLVPLAIIALIVFLIIVIVAIAKKVDFTGTIFEPGNRRAGREGEEAASNIIKSVLHEGDLLFTNVIVSYDGKLTELDNVIVNNYGVFIIEVKNYVGRIVGNEDDFEWQKYKMTDAGNIYEKTVKNPIKQVKRQIYILAHYLDYYGSRVWVNGYAILLHGNCPVKSDYVLSSVADIDRVIHTPGRSRLNKATVDAIAKLLS